jgi:DNA polymerase/3'-5' exonuclease PolX
LGPQYEPGLDSVARYPRIWAAYGNLLRDLRASDYSLQNGRAQATGPNWSLAGSVRRGTARNSSDLDLVIVQDSPAEEVWARWRRRFLVLARMTMRNGPLGGLTGDGYGADSAERRAVFHQVAAWRGVKLDVVTVEPEHYGSCLLWLTGPREFGVPLEATAGKSLRVWERGGVIYDLVDEPLTARTEQEAWELLQPTKTTVPRPEERTYPTLARLLSAFDEKHDAETRWPEPSSHPL